MRTNEEFIRELKTSGLKMVPFFKAVCVYFILNAHNHKGEYWTTVLKCGPIVGLIIFVLLNAKIILNRFSYTNKILVGLLFSGLGDALLDNNRFEYGMAAFSAAQICYIMSFGFQPLKLWIGIFLYIAGMTIVCMLWNSLDNIYQTIGLPFYTILLVTMCWRAIAPLFTAGKNSRNILKIVCAFASVLFVISDTMIAIDRFYSPISNSSIWIMLTYYAAQFGISISILDNDKIKQN